MKVLERKVLRERATPHSFCCSCWLFHCTGISKLPGSLQLVCKFKNSLSKSFFGILTLPLGAKLAWPLQSWGFDSTKAVPYWWLLQTCSKTPARTQYKVSDVLHDLFRPSKQEPPDWMSYIIKLSCQPWTLEIIASMCWPWGWCRRSYLKDADLC